MWKPSKKDIKELYQAELRGLLVNLAELNDGSIHYRVSGLENDDVLWWIGLRQLDLLKSLVRAELKRTKEKNYEVSNR